MTAKISSRVSSSGLLAFLVAVPAPKVEVLVRCHWIRKCTGDMVESLSTGAFSQTKDRRQW